MQRIARVSFFVAVLLAYPLSASALVMDYTFSGDNVTNGAASFDVSCTTTGCTLSNFSSSYDVGTTHFSFGLTDVFSSSFDDSTGSLLWSLDTNQIFDTTLAGLSEITFTSGIYDTTTLAGAASIAITYDSEATGLTTYYPTTSSSAPAAASSVPEPSSVLLLGCGLLGLAVSRRKNKART